MHRAAARCAMAALLCLALLEGASADGEPTAAVNVTTFGPTQPVNAPGQDLYLVRYEIAPGTKLPLHHHEGTQIGLVEAGELTYHVASGEVPVYSNGDGGIPMVVRAVRAGETARIGAGEWVVEEPDDRHWGANEGTERLVIVTSALLRQGAPLATRDEP